MKYFNLKESVTLGESVNIEDLVAVARYRAKVLFSEEYILRVKKARALVDQWTEESRVMYGVTTGFGSNSTRVISNEDAALLQHNIISSHATSVGTPYTEEECRAVMFMVLLNAGLGYSGVRIEVLEQYREMLNRGVTPWAPKHGSVGYLCTEAHIARVVEGSGKAYFNGQLLEGSDALAAAGLAPIPLASKEGLVLTSGSTSPTALGALGLYDLIKAAETADIIGALSFETCKGQLACIDPRVMEVKRHPEQAETAEHMRKVLAGSLFLEKYQGDHLQDALSLRTIPQLHGAAKKTLHDALVSIENEMNSCADNPVIWPVEGEEAVLSACNCDSAYVGIEMDSAAIAATNLAKMSERRNNHMIDEKLSGYPSFMVANPGLNSGLMIPQYTQAGLLNEMRMLSTSATIDNTPTCASQEDYVAMGYNACKKSIDVAEKLEYILAIELLSSYQSTVFTQKEPPRSPATQLIFQEIAKEMPTASQDVYLGDGIEHIRLMIHSGRLLELVKACVE